MLRLFASAILVLVAAEPLDTVAQAGCESKRRSCIAECRAQYFSVDPKRDACVANCVAEANRCLRGQARSEGMGKSLAHPAQRAMCPSRMAALTGPVVPQRAQPMTERLNLPTHEVLNHVLAAST